jgi:hypothetical protein
VFCNEHGKIEGLGVNQRATRLWGEAIAADFGHKGTPQGDYLVGPIAIVIGDAEFLAEL